MEGISGSQHSASDTQGTADAESDIRTVPQGGDIPSVESPQKRGKKKSRGKSAAKRGPTALPPSRGTGFEEYYADPPLTPQEAQDERDNVYSDELSFEERIHSCIQRFRSRRRLQADLTRYFNEYLFLGGIDPSPAPFSGQDDDGLAATDTIGDPGDRFYNGDRDHWSVDFTAVASGFFCSMGPITGFEPEAEATAIGVVEHFLRYVLQHDVCPEYATDVKHALQVCTAARDELPMLLRLQAALPGQFNLAAAQLSGVLDEHSDWSFGDSEKMANPKFTLLTSLALMDEPELFEQASKTESYTVTRQFECTVEGTRIYRPVPDVVKRFISLTLAGNSSAALTPVGKATFKPAIIEDGWERPKMHPGLNGLRSITLYFDDTILANMKVGMKLTMTVCELDIGNSRSLRFVKSLQAVVPTFYTFLPQELMRHFRSPKEIERPAPSVHDKGGEDHDGDEE